MKTLFALVWLAGAVLCAGQSLQVTAGLEGMTDAYLTAVARTQWEARAAAVGRIRDAAGVMARQEYIRRTLLEEIGGFPEKTPLNARITGTLDRDGYRVEKLIFESQPGFYVTACVFVPKGGRPPYPAVLGTAGHSADGKAAELYQRGWVSLARRGFLVLAYDPPGQGERLEFLDPATGRPRLPGGGTGEHSMAGIQCLLTGTNIARWFIWDGIRAFDYLLTRPDVDPARIAVTGNSGGGTQSSYLAAFEPRLAAAAPSCYLTSWEKLWSGPGPQDAEQVFVNFLKDGLDFPDFLIAFAPKPIHMATAIRDFFPIDGARATYAEARRIFTLLQSGDRAGYFEFDDTHGWSQPRREATYRWFMRFLQNKEEDGAEPAFPVDSPEQLRTTLTGQVATSLSGAQTVQSMNVALAEKLCAARKGVDGGTIPALLRGRLGVMAARGVPRSESRGALERAGYRIEKLELYPEEGITLPALLFRPSAAAGSRPAVIYVNAEGKSADAGEEGVPAALARAGQIVLAVDLRGWGEGAPVKEAKEGYSKVYQTSMRALLTGRTMAGMQTGDVLASFDWLGSRPEVDRSRIALIGKGIGAVPVLFAAALEPRVARVACEKSPVSYLGIVRADMHQGITEIVLPGVLRDFDLPDVAASLRPRPLWVVSEAKPDYAAWLSR